jgi:hypothetical protein
MGATTGRARLSESVHGADGVATTLPREEIEEALSTSDGPPELSLSVARMDGEERADQEFSIAWDRDDLEEILRVSEGSTVTLTFDRAELEGAFEDVEAHGMRERALILTVAAATAAGGITAAANAMPTDPGGGAAITAVQSAPDIVSDAGSGGGLVQSNASDSLVSDAGSGGGLVQSNASDSLVSDAGSGGGLVQSTGADSLISDAGSSGPMPIAATGDEGSGFAISSPDPAVVGALAGFGLFITGAAFTMRRRQTGKPA